MTKAVEQATYMSSTEVMEAGKKTLRGDIEKTTETNNGEKGEYIVGVRLQIVIIVYGRKSMTQCQTDKLGYA